MEIHATTSSFELVTPVIPYFNLQWNRKYYEAGSFQMLVSADVYDPAWHYLIASERAEVALVQKIEYENSGKERAVLVSGFFAEKLLDRIVCSPRYIADATYTDEAVSELCETMKLEEKTGVFVSRGRHQLGGRTQSDFLGDRLGAKAFSILETRGLSYSVLYGEKTVYDPLQLVFRVWQGKDRTSSQTANTQAVFSTALGNISKESVTVDGSSFANVCLVSANDEALQFEVDNSGGGERFEVFLDKNSSKPSDGQSGSDFRAALEQEAQEKLQSCARVVEIDISNFGSTGYRTDYDLGDLVTVELSDVGLSLDARIVEVSEVFKPSGHTVSLGLGTKRINNLERAVSR